MFIPHVAPFLAMGLWGHGLPKGMTYNTLTVNFISCQLHP